MQLWKTLDRHCSIAFVTVFINACGAYYNLVDIANVPLHSSYDLLKQQHMMLWFIDLIKLHRLINRKHRHLLPWGHSFAQIELKRQTFNLSSTRIRLQISIHKRYENEHKY